MVGRGDSVASFKELYKKYSKQLFLYLFYLTGNYHEAEDLLQETFYQAYKSLHRFKGKSKLSTWLYQIAKHVYSNSKRKPFIKGEHEAVELLTEHSTPETILTEKEKYEQLIQSISLLNDTYKEVIILRTINDLTYQEIGEVMDRSENWVRVTFYRAKTQLTTIMNQKGEEE